MMIGTSKPLFQDQRNIGIFGQEVDSGEGSVVIGGDADGPNVICE